MNETEAEKLLNETFSNKFDLENFSRFLRELFHDSAIFKEGVRDRTSMVNKQFKDYILNLHFLGKYKKNNKEIGLLAVKLAKHSSVEKARVMQRNFIANWSSKNDSEGAIVAFYGDEQDWRFSFVRLGYSIVKNKKGEITTEKELSPPKRYSYLVGPNEPNHTCKKQFLKLLAKDQDPEYEEIGKAFSIENVNKEFFEQYKKRYEELHESLEKIVEQNRGVREEFILKSGEENLNSFTEEFSKKLLGQIVFLYFLQKKGWLGVGRHDEWGSGPRDFMKKLFDQKYIKYENFFHDILEHLFYDTLARKRDNDISNFGKIPFLNGGLFEPLYGYNWTELRIPLDNSVFEKIIETFNQFNFTVKEDEPLEKEVAVDPEMLGRVFEDLLEKRDRKTKGAFYTPRKIVHYMCQSSLISYLQTNSEIPREDIEKFIDEGDRYLDQTINSSRYKKHMLESLEPEDMIPRSIKENFEKIDGLLREIKVVDPAVGSGAFLLGMMNEIVRARSILSTLSNEERKAFQMKRECIENSLYGVDIMPSATDICQLRLWLSLVVDEQDRRNIKPLPNLDYKIMCGNSLLEKFEGKDLFDKNFLRYDSENNVDHEIKSIDKEIDAKHLELGKIFTGKSNLNKNDIKKEINRLERKKKRLEKIKKPKEKNLSIIGFEGEKEARSKIEKFRQKQVVFFDLVDRDEKNEMKEEIEKIEWDIIETNLKSKNKEEALVKLDEIKKDKSKPFFLWELNFSEVFKRENSGFDIVIGNPPYIQLQKNGGKLGKDLKDAGFKTFAKTGDIYCLFYELGNRLLREGGNLTFITSNKWMRAGYGEKLRDFLTSFTIPKILLDIGPGAFETATVDTNILMFKKPSKNNRTEKFLGVTIYDNEEPISKKLKQDSVILPKLGKGPWFIASKTEFELKKKIEKIGKPLKEWDISIYRGILTGYNEAFIINNETKEALVSEDPKSEEIIKPILRGKDIKRYRTEWAGLWLISTLPSLNLDINEYPSIKEYLLSFGKEKLEQTGKILKDGKRSRKKTPHAWYELQDTCAYHAEFEKEKIVWSEISRSPSFTFLKDNYYINNTSYLINSGNKYLLGILNSNVVKYYMSLIATDLGKEGFRYIKQFIEKLPIPQIPETDQSFIAEIVEMILQRKISDPSANIADLENKINDLAYDIYQITEEESIILKQLTN